MARPKKDESQKLVLLAVKIPPEHKAQLEQMQQLSKKKVPVIVREIFADYFAEKRK
jgi:ribosomal protein L30E